MGWVLAAIIGAIIIAQQNAVKKEELYVNAQEESWAMTEEVINPAEEALEDWQTELGDAETENTVEYELAEQRRKKEELAVQKERENAIEFAANKYNQYFSGLRIKEGTTSSRVLTQLQGDLAKEKEDILTAYEDEKIDPLVLRKQELEDNIDEYRGDEGYIARMQAEQTRIKNQYSGNTWLDKWGFRWLNPYRDYQNPWST